MDNSTTIVVITKDDAAFEIIQKTILAIVKAEVIRATDTQSGVKEIEQNGVDLIITDEFGHISFNAVIQLWYESLLTDEIPLIMLVEELNFNKLHEFKKFKVEHVLPKPLVPKELYEKINIALRIKSHFSLQVVKKIKNTEVFKGFNLDELQKMLSLGFIQRFKAKEVVIKEGNQITGLGFLMKGEVSIYKIMPKQDNQLIASLTPYSLIGETALLARSTSTTRAISQKDSILFMLPYFALQLLPDNFRERLYRLVIQDLTKKLRMMVAEVCPPAEFDEL